MDVARRFKMIRAAELNDGNYQFDEAPQHVWEQIETELSELIRKMKTADRQPIRDGLRVFTNNLDRGVVDLSDLDFEYHSGEKRWVPWFDVLVDTDYKGQPYTERVSQSDDRVATRFEGRNA